MPVGRPNRRAFIAGLGGVVASPLVGRAQQPALPVIGYLSPTSSDAEAYLLAPFRKGLSEAGFVEGRNVAIEYRFAEGDVGRMPALAAELVDRQVTVVFTGTTLSAQRRQPRIFPSCSRSARIRSRWGSWSASTGPAAMLPA